MNRRKLLTSSMAASAWALTGSTFFGRSSVPATAESGAREYYLLRCYKTIWGPEARNVHDFLRAALIPAANRLGVKPVGAFNVTIGDYMPRIYVLLPSNSLELLANLDELMNHDAEFQKAGAPLLNAPAQRPAYLRRSSVLLRAMEGWPKLVPPAATAQNAPRLFELRTYQHPTDQDHVRKLEMINSGYFPIFKEAGFSQVFYGDTLVGPTMPDLTYMLTFTDMTERDKCWKAFFATEAWKKLSTLPRYTFEQLVTKVSNEILAPTEYSQI
jgi:hypothetical protein